ncbi:MAG: hypothetical protein OEW39_13555 [Deltaproteobacteria bacterium]|nr:hypothetical protein [Deltaproteobacteria bacterium]
MAALFTLSPMTDTKKPLTIHLYSFGFKHGGAPGDPSGHGGGFVFDCRALPNPFWDETLRPYSGRDAPVVAFFETQEEIAAFAEHAGTLVRYTATVYQTLGRERLMVSFGCTGGRHRSVYQAERLARSLREAGFAVLLTHLHIDKDTRRSENDDSGRGTGHPSASTHS